MTYHKCTSSNITSSFEVFNRNDIVRLDCPLTFLLRQLLQWFMAVQPKVRNRALYTKKLKYIIIMSTRTFDDLLLDITLKLMSLISERTDSFYANSLQVLSSLSCFCVLSCCILLTAV